MKRLEKIVVPTDLSDRSRRAAEYAAALSVDIKAALVIVHVAKEFASWWLCDNGFGSSEPWPLDQALSDGTLTLNRFLQSHRNLLKDVPILTKRVTLGVVSHQIIAIAKEEKADLVVLSPRHRQGWRWPSSSGTTEQVTRMCPCPVLSITSTPTPLPKRWRGNVSPLSLAWSRPAVETI
jgi:nucleotide-binding universal stress UspA family protein